MIYIQTVDLAPLGITLPSERVGMVIAQPYLPSTCFSSTEPFQYTPTAKPQALAVLAQTLTVARLARHGAGKTHFTLFPEYSIPGLEGIALVEAALNRGDWPECTIVIGGTDGLSREQYLQLILGNATHVDLGQNGGDHIPADKWVNCAITWVKRGDGTLERWIQPKIYPASQEMNVLHEHMFRGRSLYVFKGLLENGAPYRFGTLVCFDWIAHVGTHTPCEWILQDLQQKAGENQLPLTWVFVIQHNPKPSNDTFLIKVRDFFNQTLFPNALRERACLIFANTAGSAVPEHTNKFGACSLVLSPQSQFTRPDCLPTFSHGGSRFRDGSNLLANYKDIFFRERGACIHSFAQVNPGSVIPGAAGRVFAADNADVFPISGTPEPRAPGQAVPAAVKWVNDELDSLQGVSAIFRTAPLGTQITNAHQQTVVALRRISSQSTSQAIKLAAQESTTTNVDDWGATESKALDHLVSTLDILSVGFPPPMIGAVPPHATVQIDQNTVDLLSVRGESHEDCIKHSRSILTNPRRHVFLVSRDPDNTLWLERFASFLQPQQGRLNQEVNITDPASASLHLGYQNLFEIFRRSVTPAELEGGIRDALAA